MRLKRYLSMILALAMLLSLSMPSLALAEDGPGEVTELFDEMLDETGEGGEEAGGEEPVGDADLFFEVPEGGEAAPEAFDVHFDSAGGTEVADQTVQAGGYPEKPEDPTREGFAFAYWYLEGEDAQDYFESPVAIGSEVTLTAKWTDVGSEQEPGQPAPEEPSPEEEGDSAPSLTDEDASSDQQDDQQPAEGEQDVQ